MSALNDLLAFQLAALKIPFRREVALVPGRRFRWDFVVGDLAVEVNGSTWKAHTGHTSGKGIQRDCDKGFEALKAGFRALAVTGDDVRKGIAVQRIQALMK